MDPHAQPVTIQRIDYASVFRVTRLFECFRVAVHPSRLLLGLLLILSIYLGGRMLDVIWAKQVAVVKGFVDSQTEFAEYARRDEASFKAWLDAAHEHAAADEEVRKGFGGVFDSALSAELDLFERMIAATMRLDIGFDQVLPGQPVNETTVIGAVRQMCLVPVWLWDHHRGFFVAFLVVFTFLWALLGGALTRSVMVEIAAGRSEPLTRCILYAWRRLGWFVLAPTIPLMLVLLFGVVLFLGGLLFNVPLFDMLGGLMFVVALAIGFIIAVLIIGWFGGVHLMYPALAAEGTDAFDAVSRGYSYAFAHPWRLGWYALVSLLYGTVTYIVVGLFIFVTLWGTHQFVGAGVFVDARPVPTVAPPESAGDKPADKSSGKSLTDLTRDALGSTDKPAAKPAAASESAAPSDGLGKFDAMLPEPEFGRIAAEPRSDRLNWSGNITATLLGVWNYLLLSLLAAYVIAFYLSACSTIYILLRRYTDGTDHAELYEEPAPAPAPPVDKLEPNPAAQAEPQAGAAEGPGPADTDA